jgi:hypothetical protein
MDSFVPKELAILKDEMHLNEFALQLCRTHGIPERDTNGHPANIFEMNTSIATLSRSSPKCWKFSRIAQVFLKP